MKLNDAIHNFKIFESENLNEDKKLIGIKLNDILITKEILDSMEWVIVVESNK